MCNAQLRLEIVKSLYDSVIKLHIALCQHSAVAHAVLTLSQPQEKLLTLSKHEYTLPRD